MKTLKKLIKILIKEAYCNSPYKTLDEIEAEKEKHPEEELDAEGLQAKEEIQDEDSNIINDLEARTWINPKKLTKY